MNDVLILGVALLVGWAGLLFLRVPSSIAFLSLLIGQLLTTEASPNLYDLINSHVNVSNIMYVQVSLLLVPLVLTIGFMRHRVAKSKLAIEAVPTLFVVAVTILLVGAIVPQVQSLLDMATDDRLDALKSIIVIAASISGLLSAWLSYPKAAKLSSKHHE